MCCGYSSEVPCPGASNEYPQIMFMWRNKKNINTFGLKKKKHLVKSYEMVKCHVNPKSLQQNCSRDHSDIYFVIF